MDDQRFDDLARSLAGGVSRRRVLGGLLGGGAAAFGVVRLRGAGAQEGGLPPGSVCTTVADCSQDGGEVLCADNGIAAEPGLNCCRNEGGFCGSGAGCCGALACVEGVCTAETVVAEAQPAATPVAGETAEETPTDDGTAAGALLLGETCTATVDCAPSPNGPVTCASNEIEGDGALNCCLASGASCGEDSTICCGSNLCVDGVCAAPVFGDVVAGQICVETIECSQAVGPTVCGDNGVAADGALTCCHLEAVACATDEECCAGLLCGDNRIEADGARTCCAPTGGDCLSDAACCGDNFCVEGTCQAA
jgi:hypothetical protein